MPSLHFHPVHRLLIGAVRVHGARLGEAIGARLEAEAPGVVGSVN